MAIIEQRTNQWMQLNSGMRFYPLAPNPLDIKIEDIAHALSMLCRYGGHVDRFYSVAEHCVLMSYRVPPEDAMWALLHDATEAYMGDMIRPLKHHPHMGAYRVAEDTLMNIICDVFSLPLDMPESVVDADTRICLDERDALMRNTQHAWNIEHLNPLGVQIQAWSPTQAEIEYLRRFRELRVARGDFSGRA